jgi:hypothetical protein
MSLPCSKCNGNHDPRLACRGHDSHWLDAAPAHHPAPSQAERWQHTPAGRLLLGLLLTQGLAYSLRMLGNAGLLMVATDPAQVIWNSLLGLVIMEGLRGLSLLIGGALTGAGMARGAMLGAFLGLLNSCVTMVVQGITGEEISQVLLFTQPVAHTLCGFLGGLIGTRIWRPLPTVTLAAGPGRGGPKPARRSSFLAFQVPISWPRVFLGIPIILIGAVWPTVILEKVIDFSNGAMNLRTHLQAELATWEVIALVVLLGAGLAGMNTFCGMKQGLAAGIGAACCYGAAQLGNSKSLLEPTLLTMMCVLALSLVGGWLGGQLFPPVVAAPRRREL